VPRQTALVGGTCSRPLERDCEISLQGLGQPLRPPRRSPVGGKMRLAQLLAQFGQLVHAVGIVTSP
jgi:hypothetical protein